MPIISVESAKKALREMSEESQIAQESLNISEEMSPQEIDNTIADLEEQLCPCECGCDKCEGLRTSIEMYYLAKELQKNPNFLLTETDEESESLKDESEWVQKQNHPNL